MVDPATGEIVVEPPPAPLAEDAEGDEDDLADRLWDETRPDYRDDRHPDA